MLTTSRSASSFYSLPQWSSPLPTLVSQTDRSSVSFLSWPMRCTWLKAKWRWVLSHNHDHRFITIRLSSTIEPVGHCLCWDASSNHYKSWLLEYREYTTQYSLSQAVWSPYTVTTVHKFCAASAASLMAPFLTPHLDVLVVVPLVLIANT